MPARWRPTVRVLGWCAVAVLWGCSGRGLTSLDGEVTVSPAQVDFGQVWVGYPASRTVQVFNPSSAPIDLQLGIDAPFSVESAALTLQPAETRGLTVTVLATQASASVGSLRVSTGKSTQTVSLAAHASNPATCSGDDCTDAHFDPATGQCVATSKPNGTACTDACIVGGSCQNGKCAGQALDCDDHNACTADSCGAGGCQHQDLSSGCAVPDDPCQAAVCNPASGCDTVVVDDGTACGPNDCTTAHVCLGGVCEARAAPEGSVCSPKSICQDEGLCHAGSCDAPAATTLTTAWTWSNPDAGYIEPDLAADDLGNTYFTQIQDYECPTCEVKGNLHGCTFTALDRRGGVVWQRTANSSVDTLGYDCWRGPIDLSAQQTYVTDPGSWTVRALALSDGSERWAVDLYTALIGKFKIPAGTVFFGINQMVLTGDQVFVVARETSPNAYGWVVGLDRSTGALRFSQRFDSTLNLQLIADGHGGAVFALGDTGTLIHLDSQGNTTSTVTNPFGSVSTASLVIDDRALITSNGGLLETWDLLSDQINPVGTQPLAAVLSVAAHGNAWSSSLGWIEGSFDQVTGWDWNTGATRQASAQGGHVVGLFGTDHHSALFMLEDFQADRVVEYDRNNALLTSCPTGTNNAQGLLFDDQRVTGLVDNGLISVDVPGLRPTAIGWGDVQGSPQHDFQAR